MMLSVMALVVPVAKRGSKGEVVRNTRKMERRRRGDAMPVRGALNGLGKGRWLFL
jgi:hypothetical protein